MRGAAGDTNMAQTDVDMAPSYINMTLTDVDMAKSHIGMTRSHIDITQSVICDAMLPQAEVRRLITLKLSPGT